MHTRDLANRRPESIRKRRGVHAHKSPISLPCPDNATRYHAGMTDQDQPRALAGEAVTDQDVCRHCGDSDISGSYARRRVCQECGDELVLGQIAPLYTTHPVDWRAWIAAHKSDTQYHGARHD